MDDDWSKIKPLTEPEALNIVKKYIENHGYIAQRIDTDKLPAGKKAPDFEVLKKSDAIFLCEVKTPGHILNKETGMYHWDTTFNKLRNFIHTAYKQFDDYGKDHKLPRVVAFTSNHPQLNWTSMQQNILAEVKFGDQVLKDYKSKTFVIDTSQDIQSTDIYLWMQINRFTKEIYELAIFVNQNPKNRALVQQISQDLVPLPTENIKAPNYAGLNNKS